MTEEENKVIAALTANGGLSEVDISMLTGIPSDKVKEICRRMADQWHLHEWWMIVNGKDLQRFPQTFEEYLESCKGLDGDWYHNSAAFPSPFSREKVKEMLHYTWTSEEKERILEYENALLRIDLNQAISKPNDVKARRFATVFTESFGLAKVYGDQNKEDKTQKVYQLAQDILSSWSKNDVQKTMSLMRRKGDNQVAAAIRMLVKMAEAYIQLYEKMKNATVGK